MTADSLSFASNPNTKNSRSLLDKISGFQQDPQNDQNEPDFASIISSLSANSDNNNINTSFAGSEADSNDYGIFKRAGTLSLGGLSNGHRGQNNAFASASISGGIPVTSAPSTGRFLDKFSAVADATREVELLGGGLGSLSIGSTSARVPSSRRTSFLTAEGANSSRPFLESSPGSMNESLNNPINTQSTRQSISEKIDNYLSSNSNSPNQAYKNPVLATDKSRSMSISSDLAKSEHNSSIYDPNEKLNTNIWNTQSAASATTFTPMFNQTNPMIPPPNQFLPPPSQGFPPQMLPYGFPFNQFSPIIPIVSPQFSNIQPQQQHSNDSTESSNKSGENKKDESDDGKKTEQPELYRPQPQRPEFNNGSPPFIYPQAFSPFGFVPHLNEHIPFGPGRSPPPASVPQPQQPTPIPSNNQHHFQPKRNNRSPKNNASTSNRTSTSKTSKNQVYRSPLLEEFRSNSSKEYKLKDIFGSAIEFSKDQHGSRFIQQQLAESSSAEKEVIFNEIRDAAMSLMTDVFGNYVIQKYFEHGSNTQRQVLLAEMKGHIKELSFQMYGCRVVQRAIEYVDEDDQVEIISELKESVLPCIKDQNGNHVIQKAIERITIEKIDFILDSLRTQIYHLSTHPYGCRVIQRLLEFSKVEDQEYILTELNKFTYFLIQDQYGNYVIQHIIERGEAKDKSQVIGTVLGSVVEFSKHKFASNVVEKCVMYGNNEQRDQILNEVLTGNETENDEQVDDSSPLGLMMKDQFANYVVQKLVDVSNGAKKRILIQKIKQYLKQISKSLYGKHLASIEKLIVLSETALTSDDDE
ncbi:hypothetical protein WICMUC_005813 [Wickerhamomyces mucosus]|uniref:Pumilio homology domain family member 3 n=1 Tax=Wickerhamomyces mucosus TaxID=1378264 RepID=A0A9P8T317_9ASCO|nr:hypothetical protein WICMUC_005813 [Wickerhamomyces mucosus]